MPVPFITKRLHSALIYLTPADYLQGAEHVQAAFAKRERALQEGAERRRREAMLPAWLLRIFKTYSPAELTRIRADRSLWANLAWQLGSWLDPLRDRDWNWWSASINQDLVTIVVRVQGDPYSSGPLGHLIEAAGGSLVSERR